MTERCHGRRSIVAALALLLPLAACSDSNDPGKLVVCSGQVQVHVSSGTSPNISWSPSCLANQLTIVVQGGGPAWGVTYVADANLLESPVHFGVVPSGASGLPVSPAPLTAGVDYTATVYVDPEGAQGLQSVGSVNFTP